MRLTSDGERRLAMAEQTLRAHAAMLTEATRLKGELTRPLHLGSADSANPNTVGRQLTSMATRCPAFAVTLRHGSSREILEGIRSGDLDAGFYNDSGEPAAINWATLAERTWIYPAPESCCARVAEDLFQRRAVRELVTAHGNG